MYRCMGLGTLIENIICWDFSTNRACILYGTKVGSVKVGEEAEMEEEKIYSEQQFDLGGQKLD